MTPLQMELHSERKARLARMCGRAAPGTNLILRNEALREIVKEPPPAKAPTAFDLRAIEPGKLTIRDVQFYVCGKYNIGRSDMLSDKRTENLMAPRQVAAWLCHRIFTVSISEIGRKFRRDHTTILHSIRKVKHRILGDSAYCLAIGLMEEELKPYVTAIVPSFDFARYAAALETFEGFGR